MVIEPKNPNKYYKRTSSITNEHLVLQTKGKFEQNLLQWILLYKLVAGIRRGNHESMEFHGKNTQKVTLLNFV